MLMANLINNKINKLNKERNKTINALKYPELLPTDIKNSIDQMVINTKNIIVSLNKPLGYVINRGPVETRTDIYGVYTDRVDSNCLFVLIKYMDGTGVFLRYPKTDIILTNEGLSMLRANLQISL